jgi:endonuclease/exonuclease/phosphatase family metal-dependent hydrolase
MSISLRVATFNCENLFRRTKALNLQDEKKSSDVLDAIKRLQTLMDKKDYTDDVKQKIFDLSATLKEFIEFRVDNGSFGGWSKSKESGITGYRVYKNCKGRAGWSGQITFKDEPFQDAQRKNTARVIKDADADILSAIEVEGMDAIRKFNSEALNSKYNQFISIDSPNDPRGIDVACLSKYPIIGIKTHVFDSFESYDHVFSRDCLEVTLGIGGNKPLHVLCNHFKSQLGKTQKEKDDAAARRCAQSRKVVEILQGGYQLDKDLVSVMGDLNEDSSNPYQSLKPLFDCGNLIPVVDPKEDKLKRYTHFYANGEPGEKLSQLDYIFLSKTLYAKIKKVGFIREGIFGVDKAASDAGAAPVTVYNTVTDWSLSASDHAALWAEFEI